MNMQGKDGDNAAPLRQYPTEFAMPPSAQDGVVRALREAFDAERNLPGDWWRLLDRIK